MPLFGFGRNRREQMQQPQLQEKGITVTETPPEQEIGRVGPIGKEEVDKAAKLLQDYKAGKKSLDERIISNEQWYKVRHWDQIRPEKRDPYEPEPASAWLFNCIANKHADAMDNYPKAKALPREKSDEEDAKILSEVLPVVLEQNNYERTYNDVWWYKLRAGTGVTGVFWNPRKNNGVGDIDIRKIDLLNLFWEPGQEDVQKSPNLFHVELVDRDLLAQQYPFLKQSLSSPTIEVGKYIHDDHIDTSKKAAVVDWYYKVSNNGMDILHYCKFCNGEVLYASENDPAHAERGFYDHGEYPFDFDPLFVVPDSPAGFGYVDICKNPQLYIDKMDQAIIMHAVMGANVRYFIKGDGKINEEEFADWSKKLIHFTGSGDLRESLMPVEVPPLSETYVNVRNMKIEELKETSGNRDFSQGGTASGVTAASAIAALQEAGNKLSRDMLKSSYRSFRHINELCIELIRQFYTEDRMFRIVGPQGEYRFVQFNGQRIAAKPQANAAGMDTGYRKPIFDIVVSAEKSSPFSTVVQNERAKELYGMGFFRPDLADQALAALEMMDFEGIEAVRERVSQNGTMYQKIQMMQGQMMQMATIIDSLQGTNITQNMAAAFSQGQVVNPVSSGGAELQTNSVGKAFTAPRNSQEGAARAKAARAATPQ